MLPVPALRALVLRALVLRALAQLQTDRLALVRREPVPEQQELARPARQERDRQMDQPRASQVRVRPELEPARVPGLALQMDRRAPWRAQALELVQVALLVSGRQALAPRARELPAAGRVAALARRAQGTPARPRRRRTDRSRQPLSRRGPEPWALATDCESLHYQRAWSLRSGCSLSSLDCCGSRVGPDSAACPEPGVRPLESVPATAPRDRARRPRIPGRPRCGNRHEPHRAGPDANKPGPGNSRPADRGCRS